VPLVMVDYTVLQVPAGCMPPPAAFFLAEQLLRGTQTPSAAALANELLLGCVCVLWSAYSGPLSQTKRRVGMKELARQAAAAQLQRLAYCSLVGSLVQVSVNNPRVGEIAEEFLLYLSGQLLFGAKAAMGAGAPKRRNGIRANPWEVPVLLAAAIAAGASTVHVQLRQLAAAPETPAGGTSSRQAYSPRGSSSAAVNSGSAIVPACPADCELCKAALSLYEALLAYERGLPMFNSLLSTERAALEEAARQRNITLQQHLQQQLLALAWRHPVPGVCGNVLCRRLEGPSAGGAVRGPKGTLCGGCRAAWYCCKACQREAWEAHREACGGSNHEHS
jgi:hypothetical protein